jgi:hypothetical protein
MQHSYRLLVPIFATDILLSENIDTAIFFNAISSTHAASDNQEKKDDNR